MAIYLQGIRVSEGNVLFPVFLLLFCLFGFSPAFASNDTPSPLLIELTPQEREWLKQHPRIPLGVDGRWPPVDFFDANGEHSGILNAYLQYLQDSLGVTFEHKLFNSFSDMVSALRAGEIPFAATLVETEARKQDLWFTSPYFTATKVIVSNQQRQRFSTMEELYGKTLAVEEGFYLVDRVNRKYPQIHVRQFASSQDALIALATGKVDAYIGNQAVVSWMSRNLQLNNLMVTGDPGLELAQQRFAIHKNDEWKPLVGLINKALAHFPVVEQQQLLSEWVNSNELKKTGQYKLTLSNEERIQLSQLKALRLGVDDDWPPFDFFDNKRQYRGIAAEFNQALSERLGVPFVPRADNDWRATLADFRAGNLDLLSAVQATPQRREYMLFTKPYMIHPYMILVHQDTRFVNSFSDLAGKRVAVVDGYAIDDILYRAHPELNLRRYANGEAALIALSGGDVDAYVGILGSSSWILENYGIRNVKVAAPTPYQYEQAIGVSMDKPWLVNILNKAIDNIPAYQRQQIKNNWFSVEFDHQVDQSSIVRAVLITFAILLPILITIIIWNRKLNTAKSNLQESQERLAEAKDSADKANQFKSQFLANMSHEIRTPMNAIIGMNHLLMRSDLDDRQHSYAEKIRQSATNLLGVINDILDFSKVEAGHLNIEQTEFNLHRVFVDLADMLAIKAAEKGIEVLFDIDPAVQADLIGDPLRLGQILINLTQNAIKFTDSGEVVVSVRCLIVDEFPHENSARENNRHHVLLEFIVNDTGIGIEADKLQHLFEPFTQVDGSSTRKYGGTGLGLSISQQLVRLMGGDLSAESEPGVGSSFRFTLPFMVQPDAPLQQFLPTPDLRGLRVLVIDDNPTARQFLREMLESFSFTVDALASGQDAAFVVRQSALNGDPYRLIIADWQMPGINGIDTLVAIQELKLKVVPACILITAYGREDVMASAEAHHLDAFLIKPINASVLFDTIVRLFADGGSQEASRIAAGEVWLQGEVLLVEDHEINQAVALELLHSVGIIADTANNGAEAIEAVNQKHYDLVLMDLQMPVMDGLQATAIIRQNPAFKQLPIIAMTAHAMQGDKERCIATGMNDHIAKPIEPDYFIRVLSQWLQAATPPETDSRVSQSSLAEDEIEGIDIVWGIERVGGNRQLYFDLLANFYRKHAYDTQHIQTALTQGDADKARRLVHTLRGVAGNLGAELFEKDAAVFDQELRQQAGNPAPLLNGLLWQRFLQSFDQLFGALAGCQIEDKSVASEAQTDVMQSAPVVEDNGCRQSLLQLEQLLARGDAAAIQYLHDLEDKISTDLKQRLLLLIDDFEFEQACQLVQKSLADMGEG